MKNQLEQKSTKTEIQWNRNQLSITIKINFNRNQIKYIKSTIVQKINQNRNDVEQ